MEGEEERENTRPRDNEGGREASRWKNGTTETTMSEPVAGVTGDQAVAPRKNTT